MSLIKQGILIGNYKDAGDIRFLTSHKVTHILCSASELTPLFPGRFKYKHVIADDVPYFNLSKHFDAAADFIHEALRSNGTVLVHCAAGISRSVSLTIAYLMKYERLKLSAALSMIKSRRFIANPNPGFLRQLKEYESRLEELWARQERNIESQIYRPGSKGNPYDRNGARRTVDPEQEYMVRTAGPSSYSRGPPQRGSPAIAGGGLLRTSTDSWMVQRTPDDVVIEVPIIPRSSVPVGHPSRTFSSGFGLAEKNLNRNASMRHSYGGTPLDSRYQPIFTTKVSDTRTDEHIRNIRDQKSIEPRYTPTTLTGQRSRHTLDAKPRSSATPGTQNYTGSQPYAPSRQKEWEVSRVSPRQSMTASKLSTQQIFRQSVGATGFGVRAQYPLYSHPTTVLLGASNTYYIR
jgi:Dual specificity phosphatase, catalytic domain